MMDADDYPYEIGQRVAIREDVPEIGRTWYGGQLTLPAGFTLSVEEVEDDGMPTLLAFQHPASRHGGLLRICKSRVRPHFEPGDLVQFLPGLDVKCRTYDVVFTEDEVHEVVGEVDYRPDTFPVHSFPFASRGRVGYIANAYYMRPTGEVKPRRCTCPLDRLMAVGCRCGGS